MDLSINDIQICNKEHLEEYDWGGQYMIRGHNGFELDIIPGEDQLVALGNEAEKRIKKTGLIYFKLPHPSGSNLQNNDSRFINRELKKCKKFINGGK